MKYINTIEMYDEIINCDELEELKIILDKYSPYYSNWRDYINNILLYNGLSYEKLAKLCGFSKNTIKSWIKENKLPRNREGFIKFGLGLRFNLQEMNFILQRYGKYPKLYSKSIEDAICIFVITHYPQDENVNAWDILQKLKDKYLLVVKTKQKRKFAQMTDINTELMEKKIEGTKDEQEFLEFIKENELEFMNSYYKLLDYITSFVKIENMDSSYHSLVIGKGMDKGYEKMISNLRNWGEVPNRKRLISLGITLNMTEIEINQMLEYANMERLCPKDKMECIVLFVLTNLNLSNPYQQINHTVLVSKYTENPEIRQKCKQLLEELIGLKNTVDIIEDVEYYVKDALVSLDLEDEIDLL